MKTKFFNRNPGNPYSYFLAFLFVPIAFKSFHDLSNLELPDYLLKGGHYQFLTNLALIFSTVYFIFLELYHAYAYIPPNFRRVREYMSAICLSLNFVVSSVYWGLKLTIPELIMSEDDHFAFDLDLRIHALPVIFVAIDYFCFMDRWSISYLQGYSIIAVFAVAYWFWLEYLLQGEASYPYPFLNVETGPRIIIFIMISTVAFGAFCLGKILHPEFLPEMEETEKKFPKNE